MLITGSALTHWIDHFYGYGSWHAPFWFISHEEGGGDLPEEVAERIHYFSSHHPKSEATLCDIRDVYRHLAVTWQGTKANTYPTLYTFRFGPDAVTHHLWKNPIHFVSGFGDQAIDNPLHYQQNSFASPRDGKEALIRLFPLPCPHNHAWHYSWLHLPDLPFLKTRAQYQTHVYPDRMRTILSNISSYKPKVVLMYGMENINHLKASFEQTFVNTKFKLVKATRMPETGEKLPQYHRADIGETIVMITTQIPALRHHRIETGFDWNALGRQVSN